MSSEFWNERFRESEPAYGLEPNVFLTTQWERFPRGGRILCLGEGEGRNATWLASKGFQVVALDYAVAALERTGALAKSRGVEVDLVHADLATHELPKNTYDGIVAVFVHLPSSQRKAMHASVLEALKKDGVFVAEYFSPEQLELDSGGPKNPDMLYDTEDLEKDFANGKIVLLEKTQVQLQEGRYHQGRASVVQVVVQPQP